MEYIWTRYGLSGFDEGGAIIGRFYLALAAGLFGSKEDLSDFSFHTWVEPLHAVALENNRLILVAPASNIRQNLMHRCYEMIVHKVREKTNHSDFQVDILLESEWGQPQTPSFHSIEQKRHALNPAYTFDTFVVGTGNQFAHAAAVGASIAPGQKYNPLFIHGGTSLGKTHLMHAIGNAILETQSFRQRHVCRPANSSPMH